MARRYPQAQSSHLIGLVGGGMPGEPLLSFDELVRDARICRALGVREIVVFQLNGALQVFGEDFVRRFHSAVNTPDPPTTIAVPFARLVSLAHYGLAVGDAVLDSRGPHGWVGIVWLLLSAGVAAIVRRPATRSMLSAAMPCTFFSHEAHEDHEDHEDHHE